MRAAGRAYLRFARENRALYLLMFGPEVQKSSHPVLRAAATDAMTALRATMPDGGAASAETRRARHLAVGAWALVHGLAHLFVDGQLTEDLVADGGEALGEEALATYAIGLRASTGEA